MAYLRDLESLSPTTLCVYRLGPAPTNEGIVRHHQSTRSCSLGLEPLQLRLLCQGRASRSGVQGSNQSGGGSARRARSHVNDDYHNNEYGTAGSRADADAASRPSSKISTSTSANNSANNGANNGANNRTRVV